MTESNLPELRSTDSDLMASVGSLELSRAQEGLVRELNFALAENQLSTVLKNSKGEPLGVLVNPDEFNVLMHIAGLARDPGVVLTQEGQAQRFLGKAFSDDDWRAEADDELRGWTTIDEAFGEEDT